MSNLINRSAVRKLALVIANDLHSGSILPDNITDGDGRNWDFTGAKKEMKGKKYTQVSASFIDHINSLVRVNVEEYIKKMRNTGSTVK
mgnify:CR=1 FL=1